MKLNQRIDIILLILFPILALVLSEMFQLNFFFSTFLFFGVPSLYLSFRNPSLIKKTLIFSIIFSIPVIIVFDYPAYVDSSWFVPNSAFRFLRNGIPIEDAVWTFLLVYFAVIFWEYFIDLSKIKDRFSSNMKYLLAFLSFLLISFFTFYFFKPEVLNVPYFYIKMSGVLIIVPIGAVLLRFPKLIRKVLIIGVYFFMLFFLLEYVGLKHNQWYFAGEHYLGTFNFFGNTLPYDEIIFLWALGVPGIICWYEFFADDRK